MPTANEPVAGWATDCRDKYSENHDSGYAGRICLADGNLAWAAVVSDGAGGSMEGLKVSALAVQAFVEAVRTATLAQLSDPSARDAWLRDWTGSLHADAFSRFKGGMATFCGAMVLPPAADGVSWKLFTLNVGDSQVWKLAGDGRCMGVTPDAPPNNANVEGHNPIRVVGVAPKGSFCLMDIEEFPLPADGPCWILAGSDGFFSKKKGKDELAIFSSGDLRDVCLGSGAPFQELPALAIRRSLENARKLGAAEMMDNATVAMLGFRVPATKLAVPPAVSRPAPNPPNPPASAAAASQPTASGVRLRPTAAAGAKNLAIAAITAAAAGFVLGTVLFAGPSKPAERPESPVPETTSPAETPYEAVPDSMVPVKGRCPRCMALYEKGRLELRQTYHWEKDCPRP